MVYVLFIEYNIKKEAAAPRKEGREMTENNERTIALCGVWHVHAEFYCREAMKRCRILGVWEEDAERRADFCTRTGLPAFESFEDLLASGADGAIVCCATRDHAAVIPRLAAAGIDVFTEKVLAITDQDAEKIRSAVLKCGNRFMISLPHKCSGTVRAAYTAALSGRLGKLNYFRFRNVHSGSSRNWRHRRRSGVNDCADISIAIYAAVMAGCIELS